MPRIFALLVGINKYTAVSPLNGCVNDISAVEALLKGRVASDTLFVHALHDEAATRAAIIGGFRSHLGQATAGDIALFYFCGHGSQEACPTEWMALEPSGMLQTIVPVDARVGDTFDVADKELSALIHEVAERGPQVVTFFDSCSSGGVTRSTDDPALAGVPRMAPSSTQRRRMLADYIDAARALYDPARIAASGAPQPSHIAISACQPFETAKEFSARGAFTQAFEAAASALGPSATYLDLVMAIRTTVRVRAKDQMPCIAITGAADGSTRFLDGTLGRSTLTVNYAPDRNSPAGSAGAWWLSAGVIDGIPEGGSVTVSIYERDAFLRDGMTAPRVAEASVSAVEVDRARLRVFGEPAPLDSSQVYAGVVTSMGPVPLHVMVESSDAAAVTSLHTALAARPDRFAVVHERSTGMPTITVQVTDRSVAIRDVDGAVLPQLAFGLNDVAGIVSACLHIARWHALLTLTPVSSTLNGKVVTHVVPAVAKEQGIPDDRPPHPVTSGTVHLAYTGEVWPSVQLRLENTSTEKLWVALMLLSDDFSSKVCFEGWIAPRSVALVREGKTWGFQISAWRGASYTPGVTYVKVVAAKANFGSAPFVMPVPDASTLRTVVEDDEDPSFWGTSLVRIEVAR